MVERSVRLSSGVQTVIRSIHPDARKRVRATLDRIRVDPESGKPLIGELAGWWCIRVGRLRIVYRSTRTRLDVATIGPRASIYEEAARLLHRRR